MFAQVFSAIGSVLLGFAGGVAAWFLTNFYGRPLTRFFELRDQAHEEIVFTNNLGPMVDPQRLNKGAEVVRRIASRMHAVDGALPQLLRRVLLWRGYNTTAAARGLIGYANSLARPDDRAKLLQTVESALKFKIGD